MVPVKTVALDRAMSMAAAADSVRARLFTGIPGEKSSQWYGGSPRDRGCSVACGKLRIRGKFFGSPTILFGKTPNETAADRA